jgi:hypothetical protein
MIIHAVERFLFHRQYVHMYSLHITMIFYVSIIIFFPLLVLKISLDHTVIRTTIYKSSYQTDFLVKRFAVNKVATDPRAPSG